MAQGFSCFSAEFEYASVDSDGRTAMGMNLSAFVSDSPWQAVRDVIRFWNNRHRVMPELFNQLYCIKVHFHWVGGIDKNGSLDPSNLGLVFEWKCDFPGSLAEWFEHKFNEKL